MQVHINCTQTHTDDSDAFDGDNEGGERNYTRTVMMMMMMKTNRNEASSMHGAFATAPICPQNAEVVGQLVDCGGKACIGVW